MVQYSTRTRRSKTGDAYLFLDLADPSQLDPVLRNLYRNASGLAVLWPADPDHPGEKSGVYLVSRKSVRPLLAQSHRAPAADIPPPTDRRLGSVCTEGTTKRAPPEYDGRDR
jgi:hypothetical protein